MNVRRPLALLLLSLFLLMGWTAACGRSTQPSPPAAASPTAFRPQASTRPRPTSTPVPATPTATPIPAVALVNGEPISRAEWEAETQRVLAAAEETGQGLSLEEARRLALGRLVEETLLAQAAAQAGYRPSEAEVEARIQALQQEVGGRDAFLKRLQALGYPDEAAFRRALQRSMAATWMRNRILDALPEQVEQVEVRQILRYREEEAQEILARLRGGADFIALAFAYDPQTGGYLGWMPRKVWPSQALEDAVFALEPGQFTSVVASPLGYHIVYLIRKAERPLPAWAWRFWAQDALARWMQEARTQAQIEIREPDLTLPPLEGATNGPSTP